MVAGSAVFTDGLEMSVLYMKDLASSCFLLNLLATGVTIQSEIYLVFHLNRSRISNSRSSVSQQCGLCFSSYAKIF